MREITDWPKKTMELRIMGDRLIDLLEFQRWSVMLVG